MNPIVKAIGRPIVKSIVGEVRWTGIQLKRGNLTKDTFYNELSEIVMRRVLTRSSVCVDVGCHRGSMLRPMMQYAPEGLFLGFEPIPALFEELTKNFNHKNVHLYNLALGDSAGETTFTFVKNGPGFSGLKPRTYFDFEPEIANIDIKMDTLDNVLLELKNPQISLIKIDVEGAEFHVFRGAVKCIMRDKPFILFEHGLGGADCYGHGPEMVFDFLNECGMSISLLTDFLLGRSPLSRTAFHDQFYGKNYFFVAHKRPGS